MLEALAGKPAPVRQCPMTAALVDPTMAQKEGEQLLAFAAQVVGSGFPSPHQIADSLVDDVRYPHSGQFARPMQPRQSDRVPSVRLDALARPLRNQGGRNHHAVVTKIADLTAKSVTSRS